MLAELHLRDLGVIADAHVRFGPGLNVITGETGVGKTLLVTSLSLLAGSRGSARLVSHGAQEAIVEGVVELPSHLKAGLEARGIDVSEDLVLSRRLGADGKSRAWAGGRLVPVSTLAEVGEALLEIHGQGSGFALARRSAQLEAIDALAESGAALANYRESLARLRTVERERDALATDERERMREIDLLTFQIDEIDRAQLEPDEQERLSIELARLEHAERLGGIASSVLANTGAVGAAGLLAEAHKELVDAAAIDPSAGPFTERLGNLAAEAAELSREIRSWSEGLEPDAGRLDALRERKALIATLKRKYGDTVEEILALRDVAHSRLGEIESAESRRETIDAEVDAARDEVGRAAAKLTKLRKRAAKDLAARVEAELPALALPNASFEIVCRPGDQTESGADDVEFLFSSSRSKPSGAIDKIASGGELSRAMIAVTLSLASAHAIPILVFDEADQGIGGEAALDLARRLQRLGRTHQVLVVSHLPQLAAFADHHISVFRDDSDIDVQVLDSKGRLSEVSRMLAGLGSSARARAHASELLDLAKHEVSTATAQAG